VAGQKKQGKKVKSFPQRKGGEEKKLSPLEKNQWQGTWLKRVEAVEKKKGKAPAQWFWGGFFFGPFFPGGWGELGGTTAWRKSKGVFSPCGFVSGEGCSGNQKPFKRQRDKFWGRYKTGKK